MRALTLGLTALFLASATALAQAPEAGAPAPKGLPPGAIPGAPGDKQNANPCRDEVASALSKLRKTSWFHMDTSMISETGPATMQIDYVLPDKMHQKVTAVATNETSEIVLIGEQAWGNEGKGWMVLPNELTQQLKAQLYENVVEQQADVGNYACKGKSQFEGREVMVYKLEEEPQKDSTAPKNDTFRMFYVDATTGMPVSNALLAPGRETKPLFKTSYSYPVEIKIEAPKDVVKDAAPEAPK